MLRLRRASTIVVKTPTPLTFTLGVGPITHAGRLPNGKTSARALLAQNPRNATPCVRLQAARIAGGLEARARQIVFRALDPNDPDADKQAQTKANATLARIKNGEDFATLAKELTDVQRQAGRRRSRLFHEGRRYPGARRNRLRSKKRPDLRSEEDRIGLAHR